MCLIRLCVLSYSGRTLSPANPVLNSRFIGLPIMKYQLMMVLGRNRRVQGLMCVLEQDQKHGEYILLFWQKIPFQISQVNLFCLCIFSLQPTPSVGLWASQSNIVTVSMAQSCSRCMRWAGHSLLEGTEGSLERVRSCGTETEVCLGCNFSEKCGMPHVRMSGWEWWGKEIQLWLAESILRWSMNYSCLKLKCLDDVAQ